MQQLWAPWRLAYVANPKPPGEQDECFLCRGLRESDDRGNLIIHRGPLAVTVLNRFPYNNAHLLVAPKAHKAALHELDDAETLEIQHTLDRMVRALTDLMRPDGFNLGVNLGRAAGAGLPGHLHWHVVPRWNGDTNFMPVLADVRVIVQALESAYEMLTGYLATPRPSAGGD